MTLVRDGAAVGAKHPDMPRPQLASGGHPDRRITQGTGGTPSPATTFPPGG